MSDIAVGRVYPNSQGEVASALNEMLLQKAEKERDHYKQALEEISSSTQDWLDSLIQEPSVEFIRAIKVWADKSLKKQ
jgi:vacuolar-type H+-ATPase subunit E/Vma4